MHHGNCINEHLHTTEAIKDLCSYTLLLFYGVTVTRVTVFITVLMFALGYQVYILT